MERIKLVWQAGRKRKRSRRVGAGLLWLGKLHLVASVTYAGFGLSEKLGSSGWIRSKVSPGGSNMGRRGEEIVANFFSAGSLQKSIGLPGELFDGARKFVKLFGKVTTHGGYQRSSHERSR